mmetsp:Transcript_14966/g.44854  ORF Transcript_14966/g.44854 Transcript_14966/m.44854 type:complete len:218 (-) Transcript_14966:662-1315(-)
MQPEVLAQRAWHSKMDAVVVGEVPGMSIGEYTMSFSKHHFGTESGWPRLLSCQRTQTSPLFHLIVRQTGLCPRMSAVRVGSTKTSLFCLAARVEHRLGPERCSYAGKLRMADSGERWQRRSAMLTEKCPQPSRESQSLWQERTASLSRGYSSLPSSLVPLSMYGKYLEPSSMQSYSFGRYVSYPCSVMLGCSSSPRKHSRDPALKPRRLTWRRAYTS